MKNRASFDRFKESMEKWIVDVENDIDDFRNQIAEDLVKRIIARSPVQTGSYVLSHRVGADGADNSIAMRPDTYIEQNPDGLRTQVLADLAAEIKRVPKGVSIYVSNSVGHAPNVEYIGWKRRGPYHVYGLSVMEIKAIYGGI
jgi:hypothetical protein